MASDIIDGVSEQLDQLRQALKEWERAYAAANGGRKASREDIKKDPTIALKYKDYNRLRPLHTNTVSQKPAALPASQLSPSKKRKHRPVPSTPVKRPRSSQQMSPVRTSFTGEKDPYESPATVRSLFRTPTIKRTSFGPTPQKDGKVLGLFDNLSPGSAKKAESQVQLKSDFVPVQVSTPQKNLQAEASQGDLPISSNNQLSLPAATPSRRRGISNGITTPQSSSVLQFLTPEFLRRDSRQIRLGPSAIDQREHFHAGDRAIAGDIGDSPVIIRMPAKAPIKGLSAILADLRKADQERFDDDEEALRETEGKPTKQPTTLVEDSQMPLGADGEIFEDDSEDDDAVTQNRGRDGEPLKIWKKKGQKRTTRRVIMRPVRHKAKSQGHTIDKALDSEDEEPSDEDVEDSEAGKGPINTSTLPPDVSIEDEDIDASEFSPPTNGSDHAKGQPKSRAKPSTPEDQGKTRTEKAPRKGKTNANATSHANFRRLKLRNRNSKGAGGGGGRYGRGRR